MQTNDKSLSAAEKIKQLLESERVKGKEVEQKKKELEEKKKEIEQLEKKRKKETATANEEIEEQIEEITTEEKIRYEELEELRRKREAEESTLEEAVEQGERNKDAAAQATQAPQVRGYGELIQEIIQGNPTFYDITNYNVMNRLEEIAAGAASRPLTPAEKTFVEMVQYHVERFGKSDFFKGKDEANYLAREMAKIDHISKMAKDANRMPKVTGDYET